MVSGKKQQQWYQEKNNNNGIRKKTTTMVLGGKELEAYYWTSSEYDANNAWCWDFKFGADDHSYGKETSAWVRSVRTF